MLDLKFFALLVPVPIMASEQFLSRATLAYHGAVKMEAGASFLEQGDTARKKQGATLGRIRPP